MDMDWHSLIGVRDHQLRRAQQAAAEERRVTAMHEARERDAERQWQRQVQDRQAHEQGLRLQLRSQGATIGDLCRAGQGDQALVRQIEREAQALNEARMAVQQQRQLLAASLQRLRQASAGLEKAQRLQEEAQARCRRLHLLRMEDVVEEAALRVWSSGRPG